MNIIIAPYLDWLLLHPVVAHLVIYGVCVLTCLAGIGCVMPSIVLFTSLGTLIGLAKLPFVSTLLCAIGGSFTGSALSFWIGYHYQASLRQTWLLRSCPQILIKSEVFFKRFGEVSIFIGRFLGPIRAFLPLIAGMTGMRIAYFLLADIASAILWPMTYILPGIYLVHSLSDIIAAFPIYPVIYVTTSLVILYFTLQRLKPYYYYPVLQAKEWFSSKLIRPIVNDRLFFHDFLQTPFKKPTTHLLLLGLILSVLFLAYLIFDVLSNGILSQYNMLVYSYVGHFKSVWISKAWIIITLFNAAVICFFWFTILVTLVVQKQHWHSFHWAGLGVLSVLITEGLKVTMSIPRPANITSLFSGSSFPSGHVALNATLFAGFIALLNLKSGVRQITRQLTYSLYMISIVLIGFSRLYLYAHWLTDIIGAVLVSAINLLVFQLSYHRKNIMLQERTQLVYNGVISLIIGWTIHFILRYQILLTHYLSL